MHSAWIGFLCAAIAALPAGPQRPSTPKGSVSPVAQSNPESNPTPTSKGTAPAARVQIDEPIQPTQIQTRDGDKITSDPRAKYRTVVRMMVNVERAHRERVARLERLHELFTASAATESLATVDQLVAVERRRYENALNGYRQGLGDSLYVQVRAVLDTRAGAPLKVQASAVPPERAGEPAKATKAPGQRLIRH